MKPMSARDRTSLPARLRTHPALALLALASLVVLAPHLRDASAQDAPISRARIEAALARYRDEPSVGDLVRAAIAVPTLDPGRVRDALERARLSGLLPQARGTLQHGQALDLSERQSGTVVSSGDDLSFGASLTFRLDRLLYASEEASLLREQRHLEERRLAIVTQLVHVYYERRRLQLERDLGDHTDVALELRIAEAEALLDVFTDGAFSRMMSEVARDPRPDRPEDASSSDTLDDDDLGDE